MQAPGAHPQAGGGLTLRSMLFVPADSERKQFERVIALFRNRDSVDLEEVSLLKW